MNEKIKELKEKFETGEIAQSDIDIETQKEIAKELGISRSYVSRIEKRALTKMLKEFIKNNNS